MNRLSGPAASSTSQSSIAPSHQPERAAESGTSTTPMPPAQALSEFGPLAVSSSPASTKGMGETGSSVLEQSQIAATEPTQAPMPPGQDVSTFGQAAESIVQSGTFQMGQPQQSAEAISTAPQMPPAQDHRTFGTLTENTAQASLVLAAMPSQFSSSNATVAPPMPPIQDDFTFGVPLETAPSSQPSVFLDSGVPQSSQSLNSFTVVDQMPGQSASASA